MMRLWWLLLFPFSLSALTVDVQLRRANALGEAGNYSDAQRHYRLLLARTPEPWKRAILTYNIARLYQLAGDNAAAIKEYRAIPPIALTNRLFFERIGNNATIALWELARAEATKAEPLTYTQIEKLLLILRTLFNELDSLEARVCLKDPPQNSVCPFTQKELILRHAAETLENRLLEEKKALLPRHITAEEELIMLHAALEALIADYPLIGDASTFVEQTQRERMESEMHNWYPLWDAIVLEMENAVTPDLLEQLTRSRHHYMLGSDLLRDGAIATSNQQLNVALRLLQRFTTAFFHNNAVEEALHRLTLGYKRAIGASWLITAELVALQKLQLQLIEKLEEQHETMEEMRHAAGALESSITAKEAGDNDVAMVELIVAYQHVRRQLWGFSEVSSQTTIEQAIEQQNAALLVNQTALKDRADRFATTTIDLQNAVLSHAETFRPIVTSEQEEAFAAGHCLCHPWEKVLPLFTAGQHAAEEALTLLRDGHFFRATLAQERASKEWRAALEQLQQPEPAGGNRPREEPEFLRLLQLMEQDDRTTPMSRQRVKKGKRPW